MIKLKTRKANVKRFKKIGNLKFIRRHACKSHLLMKKSKKRKRKLTQKVSVHLHNKKAVRAMMI